MLHSITATVLFVVMLVLIQRVVYRDLRESTASKSDTAAIDDDFACRCDGIWDREDAKMKGRRIAGPGCQNG